ncbi:hypothetical protein [Streptomyces fradiae]|uniref:hypothetical protein n=1 Tax=Streptomyces fradiae TaxID=1906 RepID=UPI0033CAF727
MSQKEPEFWVLEYVTITQDPRTGLVVAIGGTERAADILQRSGFLSAPGPRGDYHRLPQALPFEQQRLKATAAAHALLTVGHSVHLDPALNTLTTPDGEGDTARRYLAQLAERTFAAKTSSEVAEVLTEIAAPVHGLLPLVREVVVGAWNAAIRQDAHGEEAGPVARLGDTTDSLSHAAYLIRLARDHVAGTPREPAAPSLPPGPAQSPAARRR